jgi:uncharacterized protein with von Willebrand factor type A (vWA) domain
MRTVPGFESLAQDSRNNVICSTLATKAVVKALQALPWPDPPTDKHVAEQTHGNEVEQTSVRVCDGPGGGGSVAISRTTSFKDGSGATTTSERKTFASKAEAEAFKQQYLDNLASRGAKVEHKPGGGDMEGWEAALAKMLDNVTPGQNAQLRKAARNGVEESQDEAEDIIQAVTTCYGNEAAKHSFKDPSDADFALLRSLMASRELAEFVKIVGRFMKAMRRSRVRERVPGKTVPIGTERARDLRNLLPTEAALLAVPGMRGIQIDRVLGKRAQGRRMWDYSSKGNGPVHVALDISGSMSSFCSPQGVYYGNAFAAAACLFAIENKRDVSCSVFDTDVTEIPVNAATPSTRSAFLQAMLAVEPNGGTSFIPLFQHVDTLGYCDDVLLISDGCGSLDEAETRRVMAKRNLNYLILGGSAYAVDPVLRDIAGDRCLLADDLLSDGVSKHAARAVARRS